MSRGLLRNVCGLCSFRQKTNQIQNLFYLRQPRTHYLCESLNYIKKILKTSSSFKTSSCKRFLKSEVIHILMNKRWPKFVDLKQRFHCQLRNRGYKTTKNCFICIHFSTNNISFCSLSSVLGVIRGSSLRIISCCVCFP